jgi:hypothetical protein
MSQRYIDSLIKSGLYSRRPAIEMLMVIGISRVNPR